MIPNDPIEAAYYATVAACALILGVRFSVAWLRHNRQRDDLDREPRCGTCGYIVAKCTSTICPECGRDVCEQGLITSRACPRIGIAPVYILLALIALPMTMSVGVFLARWQPMVGWRYHYEQMVAMSRDSGASFGPPRYSVQSEGSGRFFSRRPDYVWAYCNSGENGNSHPMLVVDLHASQFWLVDSAGNKSPAQPIAAPQVCEFLRLRSPNDSDAQLMNASERIVSAIHTEMTGNLPSKELQLFDSWNGASLSYSIADSVIFAMWLLSWAFLSIALFVAISVLKRLSLRKRRKLWRKEFERLGLAR